MKVRVVLMTENDEHICEPYSDEDLQKITKQAWDTIATWFTTKFEDKVSVEKVEIVER